jgi:predicted permease
VAIEAFRRIWERLDALPGVVSSGGVSTLPLSGFQAWGPITIEGHVPPAGQDFINADQRIAGGRYFETMRIPLVAGRYFSEADQPGGPRSVIVDERLAGEYWPGQDPIGKRLRTGPVSSGSTNWMTVVGVVGRVKQYGLDADGRIVIYVAQTQAAIRSVYVTIRTAGDPLSLLPAVRSTLRDFDPDLPVYRVRTMDVRVEESLARPRFAMTLLTVFAGVALVLAAIGIYGVMARNVTARIREFGVRLALGARPAQIQELVLRQAFRLVALGAVLGIGGALGATRFLRALLFEVNPVDPASFIAAVLLLSAAALAASWLPARRATSADPLDALRTE